MVVLHKVSWSLSQTAQNVENLSEGAVYRFREQQGMSTAEEMWLRSNFNNV